MSGAETPKRHGTLLPLKSSMDGLWIGGLVSRPSEGDPFGGPVSGLGSDVDLRFRPGGQTESVGCLDW